MSLERALLVIGGPLFVASGLLCAATPATFAELAGFSASASGLTDVRAVYGGFQLGLGAFLIWCAREPERASAGLVAMGLALAGVAGMRALGMLIDQAPTDYLIGNLVFELGGVALVWVAMKRVRAVAPA